MIEIIPFEVLFLIVSFLSADEVELIYHLICYQICCLLSVSKELYEKMNEDMVMDIYNIIFLDLEEFIYERILVFYTNSFTIQRFLY